MSIAIGIESSSIPFSVALWEGDTLLFTSSEPEAGPFAKDLAALVESALKQAAVQVKDIQLVAVDIGPGRLTSVRSGVSFANGLAFSLGVPLWAPSFFELVGFEAWQRTGLPVLCTRQTGGGKAFAALYAGGVVHGCRFGDLGPSARAVLGDRTEFAVAGTFRAEMRALLPDATIVDSEIESPTARSLFGMRNAIPGATLHAHTSPLDEQSAVFHG